MTCEGWTYEGGGHCWGIGIILCGLSLATKARSFAIYGNSKNLNPAFWDTVYGWSQSMFRFVVDKTV